VVPAGDSTGNKEKIIQDISPKKNSTPPLILILLKPYYNLFTFPVF
jgi:hypothetical protein